MGQKRKNKSDNKLPKYVYPGYKTYDYKPVLENGKRGFIRLCPLDSPISRVWEEWEKLQSKPTDDLAWLLNEYLSSREFRFSGSRAKSPRTIAEQERQALFIKEFKIKGGRTFGEISRKSITRGVIRGYLDKRAEQGSPVAGNREKSLISKAWNWALERDKIMEPNPCQGVTRNPEQARTRYVTPEEYAKVYRLAQTKSKNSSKEPPNYIPICMELAYLCRMRISEILRATKSDVTETGFITRRVKRSNDALTLWSDRLRVAVQQALELPGDSVLLIHNRDGQPIKYDTFSSSWGRLMEKAELTGIERFTFHDLKAAGVSDFEGNKQAASGHKSPSMVSIYDRKRKEVKPTD